MKVRVIPVRLWVAILVGAPTGCSSTPREIPKHSVVIAIRTTGGAPSPTDVASIHKKMQPEIEKYGYVMATNPRSADYVVYVRYPFDPLASTVGRITFVKVEANGGISGRAAAAAAVREFKTNSERAIAEHTREPKE